MQEHLKGWSSERLSKTSISLLRLSIAEMLYGEPDMDSVIVNEAVELAKKYAGEKDYQFVNGVLGTVSRQLHPVKEEA
jgi:N utilization substance protein B